MNEMVERPARAICASDDCDPDALNGAVGVVWKLYEDDARAAIEAMRHPACDAAMMDAGMKAVIFGGSPDSVAWNVFHVMIDAALAGAPTARPSPSTGSTQL